MSDPILFVFRLKSWMLILHHGPSPLKKPVINYKVIIIIYLYTFLTIHLLIIYRKYFSINCYPQITSTDLLRATL